jgi:hypothetical protein
MAGERPGLFLLYDGFWDPGEAVKHRNLGCPLYDECLNAALAASKEAAGKRRSRHSWKLENSGRTWICDPKCPHRGARDNYAIEILKSSHRDE